MPLWSNEEWRARIGSCWCVLGNTDQPSENHQSYKLCGRTMLQAVSVLMLLIFVQRIKGGITECRKLVKTSFYLRKLLLILILLLQAKVFIQSSLLLRCGDVELNPGPGIYPDLDYEHIDDRTVLTEDDFREVYREVVNIQSTYYQFGIELGLPLREMDAVKKAFHQDVPQAFTEVLRIWLRHRYNVEKYGLPTWRRLIEAVDNPAGGNNHALAKTIAEHHPAKLVAESTVCHGGVNIPPLATLSADSEYHSSAMTLDGSAVGNNHTLPISSTKYCSSAIDHKDNPYSTPVVEKTIAEHHPPTVSAALDNSDNIRGNIHTLSEIGEHNPLANDENASDHKIFAKHHHKDTEALVQTCRDTMAAYYLKQVDDRAWPPVKSTNFVNLALIKDQASWRKTVQKSVDEIVGQKTTISYQSMTSDHCIGTFTLLEGRPGSGKTVLMNKISCDWAKGEILKSTLLIFIPLRRLGAERDRKLSTLLQVACGALPPSDVRKLVSHIEHTQGEGVVFAFDGFDEYVPIIHTVKVPKIKDSKVSPKTIKLRWYDTFRRKKAYQVEDLFEILNGRYLTKSTIFVTSRPAACIDFREHAKKRIEVLGFLKPQIIEYVNCYFSADEKKAQLLVAHLEHHPNLLHMAYLPLHCAMLAFLYEDDTVLPETEIEFYKHFTLSTLLRSIRRKQGTITTIVTSFDQLPHREKVTFDKICKLAFDATINSKQVFTSVDIESVLPDKLARNDMSDLGLIVTDHYFMRYGLDDTYTFLHLTFQEYLAAVYIAGLNELDRMDIIEKYKYKKNLSVVWRFLCGMMDFSCISSMDTFKNLIKAIEDEQLLVKIQCCYETRHTSPCCYVIKALNGQLKFNDGILTPLDFTAIGYTINSSDLHLVVHLTFKESNFSSEGTLSFLQQVGDHPLSLTINKCVGASDFMDSFRRCPAAGLHSLNFSGNGIGDAGVQTLFEGLKHCADMKELNLSSNSIGEIGAQDLGEGLKCCTSIEKLNLSDNSIDDTGAYGLAEGLKHCANVKELNLSGNSIGDTGLQALVEGLRYAADIEELNLRDNLLSDTGVQALLESQSVRYNNLKKLNLSCNKVCAHGVWVLGRSLLELNLASNNIDDVGAQNLSETLRQCRTIRKLSLKLNYITASGIQPLIEHLKHCTKLQELNIGYNDLSDDAVPHLIVTIQTFKSLEILGVEHNNLTASGVQCISSAITERNKNVGMAKLSAITNHWPITIKESVSSWIKSDAQN